MTSTLLRMTILGIFLIAPTLAQAEDLRDVLSVQQAYAFATGEMQKNGAAFMKFENKTDKPLSLTKAEAEISETVELHTHITEDDIMKMREVKSFELPPEETRVLEPMGDHIMLMGLTQQLIAGEKFPLELHFEGYEPHTIFVEIIGPGADPDEVLTGNPKYRPDLYDPSEHVGHNHPPGYIH